MNNSTNSEKIFSNVCRAARILRSVSVCDLRHSLETHVLESRTGVRYVREILGHRSSKTSEIYTHLSNKDIGKFESSLDNLNVNQKKG